MKKAPRMCSHFHVYAGAEGHVVIADESDYEKVFIAVHPAQVPILIKWLREVAEEVQEV